MHSLLAGRHASRLRGRGLNFEELRGYLPGDDVRSIDWKTTQRTGKPHIRSYTEERDRPAYLVVDQRRSMFFGSRFKMKSVTAAELGAIGAWRILDQGDRAGAIVFNDESSTEIRPQRSRNKVLRILGEIVRYNKSLTAEDRRPGNPGMLNEVLRRIDRLARHDCLVCIITDMLGADSESLRLMTRLARHNDVIVGFVFDPLEQGLPALGRQVFSNGESQLEVDTSDQKLRDAFTGEFERRLEEARKVLLQRAVPLIPVSAAGDPLEQIQKLLGYARSARTSS